MQFVKANPAASLKRHAEWAKAATSTNQADPFCCAPTWQLSFHAAFSPMCRLLIEESAGAAIFFAEHAFSPEHVYLTPLEPHWSFGCPVLGRHGVELLSDAVEYCAERYAPFFPRIVISGIRPKGELARRLTRTFGGRFSFVLHSTGLQCAASLAGGLDGFLSRRSANHRGKLNKGARRAAEKGVYFERVAPSTFEESSKTYERMLAVERASWKGVNHCGMAEPPAERFYAILLSRLAIEKKARVIFARHEHEDIGFIFGGMAGKIYRGQQFSYKDEWKSLSIGNLMQVEKVRWLCEEGARRYDMGPLSGPRMQYKAHWTEKEISTQNWVLEKK